MANYLAIEFSLRRAAIKVGAHTRNGNLIRAFRRGQKVAAPTMKVAKAGRRIKKATQGPTSLAADVGSEMARNRSAKELVKGAKRVALNSNKVPGAAKDFISSGDLPSRKLTAAMALRQSASYTKDFIRNPRRTINRGLEREKHLLANISRLSGKQVTRGEIIRSGLALSATSLPQKVKKSLSDPETYRELTVNIGGLGGSIVAAPLGPAGTLAGDLLGSRAIRRGVDDFRALGQAFKNQEKVASERLPQFNQILKEARKIRKEVVGNRKRNDFAGDLSGWASGNATATFSPVKLPGIGAAVGMPVANYFQAVESRMTNTGETLIEATAKIISDNIKKGNAKEAVFRQTVKENWKRLTHL